MYRSRSGTGYMFGVWLVLYTILLIIALNISDSRPFRAAQTMGFTDVKMVSYTVLFTSLKGCGLADAKEWYMEGTNAQGQRVSFIVCGGFFKDNTIRVR